MYPISHQELEVSLRLRLDVVENIFDLFTDERFANTKFNRTWPIIAKDLTELTSGFLKQFQVEVEIECAIGDVLKDKIENKFVVHSHRDIVSVMSHLESNIIKYGFKFFEENKSVVYLKNKYERFIYDDPYPPILNTVLRYLILTHSVDKEGYRNATRNAQIMEKLTQNFDAYSLDATNELIVYLDDCEENQW